MIIHPQGKQHFCKRVQYSHETNVFRNTSETQKFIQTFKSSFRVRKCMSAPKFIPPQNNYNHYYINPELRYKKRTVDPKKQKINLVNQQYVYNKIHDQKFNNWRHPFEKDIIQRQQQKQSISEQDIKKLIKFKQYIEDNNKGRIPQVLNEFIKQKK